MKIPHSHQVGQLYNTIKSQIGKPELDLNIEYLTLLSKVYKLRYPDDLEIGFNISLNQAKLIAQLDRSVQELTNRFRIVHAGEPVLMVLDQAKQNNDMRFLDRNVAVDPAKDSILFSSQSRCYELRNRPDGIIEAHYSTLSAKDDLIFDTLGMSADPTNTNKFNLAYLPI